VAVAVLGLHDLYGLDFGSVHVEGCKGLAGGGVGVFSSSVGFSRGEGMHSEVDRRGQWSSP
jgi:hypothetical protein